MKRLTINSLSHLAMLVFAAFGLLACETEGSVSGTMQYAKSYGLVDKTEHFIPGTPCATFAAGIQSRVEELAKEYAEAWEVPYSGITIDSALYQYDQEAYMGFEAAYFKLYKLGEEIKEQIASSYLGAGSFSYDYAAIVRRNIILYQSHNVNFSYNATDVLGTINYAIRDSQRGMGIVRIPEDVNEDVVVRTARVLAENLPVTSTEHALYSPDLALWGEDKGAQFARATLSEDGAIELTLNLSEEVQQQITDHAGTWYYIIKGRTAENRRACVEVAFTIEFNENI